MCWSLPNISSSAPLYKQSKCSGSSPLPRVKGGRGAVCGSKAIDEKKEVKTEQSWAELVFCACINVRVYVCVCVRVCVGVLHVRSCFRHYLKCRYSITSKIPVFICHFLCLLIMTQKGLTPGRRTFTGFLMEIVASWADTPVGAIQIQTSSCATCSWIHCAFINIWEKKKYTKDIQWKLYITLKLGWVVCWIKDTLCYTAIHNIYANTGIEKILFGWLLLVSQNEMFDR